MKKKTTSIAEKIKIFLGQKNYTPLTEKELFAALTLSEKEQKEARKAISEMIANEVISVKKNKLKIKEKTEEDLVITGILHAHPKGFGFVEPDNPTLSSQDVFIPKHLMHQAVDGDKVKVVVNTKVFSPKGPEGKIIEIIERKRSVLAGTIRSLSSKGTATAYVPLLGNEKPVTVQIPQKTKVKVGDRYLLKINEWPEKDSPIRAQLEKYLGNISDPSCDIIAAIHEHELPLVFSKSAIEEAKAFGSKVPASELKKRKDLTKTTVFTIDPTTAKDFDDALSIKKNKKGEYSLGVHIADVAHYIPENSFLDQTAKERCNSTYFPGVCLPMLPEELSNNLCSLKAKVIRLTISVFMEFDKEGDLLHYEIVRSYIKSAKRFTYEEAYEVIQGKKKSTFAKELELMTELCLLLKKKRSLRGSIDFALPEAVIQVDAEGEPTGIKVVEYDISHQLVEEFMLKANEIVAKHLSDEGKPVVFRIHESPSSENFKEFCTTARALGFSLSSEPNTEELQLLFDAAKKTPFGQQLAVSFIRMMKMAYYSPENVGHFGLALDHYCHFTSPIRRYTDLVVQRLVFDQQKELEHIKEISERCSAQERVSMKAENSVKQLKKLRLLLSYQKKNPDKEYIAAVTRVKPYGLFFEIPDVMLEGFIHISHLENDYFIYDEKRSTLVGKHTSKIHKIGEFLPVRLESVDLIELQAFWVLANPSKKRNKNERFR